MNMQNIFCSFSILLSTATYCANITTYIDNKEKLARSLYGNDADLSSLSYEATMLHVQTLIEKKLF